MSHITDMLLLTNEEPGSVPVRALNAWCKQHADGQVFKRLKIERNAPGGHKVFTTEVYACAGNFFPWEKLLEVLPSFGWDSHSAEITALILQDEAVERWIAVHADGRLVAPSHDANRLGGMLTIARAPTKIDGGLLLRFNGVYWNAESASWKDEPRDATVLLRTGAGYMLKLLGPSHPGIEAVLAEKVDDE